ncbi:YlxM family DNA-binding protein [Lactobacillus mulieris]|uniref:YlxM family DNA-binding protein n=1 Tax=Lactobacillus mulieris TaxID=2508708 RepID=UPI00143340A3|nr:YlxM family DNA-binding protein [Lactobacillus mulieris]MCF1782989.1 YlxM family DNA-binding protein [Lactobacillus mulieris]MCW8103754.1 YlxM family DNA-binding protein [Lactobacillus mulieris]MDK6802711.1 YlxM family DNA-binding protein [Lactobacillus mulieris]MDK8381827.1 YlxM family DNA-binding protein [Lactobacillus mulieris]MDT9620037.1 YlxM family DNA-binding protein [Lactobacillus mulieris]
MELIKNEELADLYSFYGQLLTKGQQAYFEDYYYDDLSLGEIADNHGVSRQAVYDNLRRSSKSLENYEKKLHLKSDYVKMENLASKALKELNSNPESCHDNLTKLIKLIRGE